MGDKLVQFALAKTRKLIATGRHADAYDMIEHIKASGGSNRQSCFELEAEAQTALLMEFQNLYPDMDVLPIQTCEMSMLRDYPLRSHEVYIWTMFDGMTSLENAVDLSPLDELQTLRIVRKLEDLGILKIASESVA